MLNRRMFLAGLTATAAGLLVPERRVWALDQTMVAAPRATYTYYNCPPFKIDETLFAGQSTRAIIAEPSTMSLGDWDDRVPLDGYIFTAPKPRHETWVPVSMFINNAPVIGDSSKDNPSYKEGWFNIRTGETRIP